MKRVGGLFEAIADAQTMTKAAWRAARGKRQRPEVRRFLGRLDHETGRLVRALRDGSFQFGQYRTFAIRDPKSRTIHAPPFHARVVHHALIAVTGPVFERGAISHSYACRAGRGQHAAIGQVRRWLHPGDWFLKLDVAKFYDNVDHAVLRTVLARHFRERRLLDLFDRLLASHTSAPGKGLPIGGLTSQYLGNFYLSSFDHWVNQSCRIRRYIRYMDDLLFLGDQESLRHLQKSSAMALAGLGLKVKNGGILNTAAFGIPYLGFVIYPNRVRLNQQGRRRLRRKTKILERAWESDRMGDCELQARAEALFAHARFGDDLGWRRMVTRFSRIGEMQEPVPRPAGRLLGQFRQVLPLGVSRLELAGCPPQVSTAFASVWFAARWHWPPDDASSRARLAGTKPQKSLPCAEIRPRVEKARGGAICS